MESEGSGLIGRIGLLDGNTNAQYVQQRVLAHVLPDLHGVFTWLWKAVITFYQKLMVEQVT